MLFKSYYVVWKQDNYSLPKNTVSPSLNRTM